MRTAIVTLATGIALALLVVWGLGGLDGVRDTAQAAQREFQARLAGGLRALHAGQPGALGALWSMCFAYGFVHAAGPGHGKFLLGAYGAGTQVPLRRLMGVGLAASLAQGAFAVALVYGGVLVFNASRESLQYASDVWLDRASLIAIAAVGAWLVWRGARRLGAVAQWNSQPVLAHGPVSGSGHHHHHHHHRVDDAQGAACESCGHRHGPTLSEVAGLHGWRDTAALIGAIAMRPCTGALFLLILTWRMGLVWQGIAGALIMALGTASVTVTVAALAVLARDGALGWAQRMGRLTAIVPVVEVLAGLTIVILALNMLKIF
ncbi:nickel/cobalt transporter [Roseinatronobacter sp.]